MSNTVPEGWQVRSIGDLVTLQYGKSPKEVMAEDGQYPVIGTGGVTGYASSYLYDGCTTVIGRKGTINKPSYVEGKFWAIDTTYFGTGYKEAEPKWLYYSLNSFDLSKYNEASGVPSLGRDTLNAIPLLTPPLPEQQKIAAILSSVDNVIEKTRAQIDKLKDLKTGMMQELLTKGVGSGGVPHTEFKDSPVGRIPARWNTELLDKVAARGSGHTPSKSKPEYWNGGIDWVSLSDTSKLDRLYINATTKQVSELGIQNSSAIIHPPGTVVLSRDAGIGKSAITTKEMAVSQHFIAWRCSNRLDNHFLYYLLQFRKPKFESIAMGSTIKTIGLPFFKQLHVPIPPMSEQEAIAGALKSTDLLIFAAERRLDATVAVKKGLMQDLLTAKVRVNVTEKETAVA